MTSSRSAGRARRRPHRLLLAAAVALAAVTAPASAMAQSPAPAVEFAVGSAPMVAAQAIARDAWGMDACGGAVTITWQPMAPSFNAESTWSNPSDSYADPAANDSCSIEFNTLMTYDWPKFCTVVVHEYGHLDGHRHSADPRDVMAPVYDGPTPACAAMPEPGAPSATAVRATSKAKARATASAKRAAAKKAIAARRASQATTVR